MSGVTDDTGVAADESAVGTARPWERWWQQQLDRWRRRRRAGRRPPHASDGSVAAALVVGEAMVFLGAPWANAIRPPRTIDATSTATIAPCAAVLAWCARGFGTCSESIMSQGRTRWGERAARSIIPHDRRSGRQVGSTADVRRPRPETQGRFAVLLDRVGEPSGHPAIDMIASPAVGRHPADEAIAARAKSTLGSRPMRLRTTSSTSSTTAIVRLLPVARRSRSSSTTARGSAVEVDAVAEPWHPLAGRDHGRHGAGRADLRGVGRAWPRAIRLAPPCSGPLNTPSPAFTAAYGWARVDAATRTASVDAASSWSAISTSAALTTASMPGGGRRGESRVHSRPAIVARIGVPPVGQERVAASLPSPATGSESTTVAMRCRPAAATASALGAIAAPRCRRWMRRRSRRSASPMVSAGRHGGGGAPPGSAVGSRAHRARADRRPPRTVWLAASSLLGWPR